MSINVVKQEISSSVFKLVRSPLIQGQALSSLLALFVALVRINDKEFSALVSALVEPATAPTPDGQFAFSKQAFSTIVQYIAVLCINSAKKMGMTVSEFVRKIEDARSTDSLKFL
ncbi:MAG: hypothetical protein J3Q66DRAFT_429840 [Benniella sp.]|nr:MAG: hypothetical protein J3Q66DRAFT_429840 [Benniella sp.]